MKLRVLALLTAACVMPASIMAATLEVGKGGADAVALQTAIMEAADGDVVLVHPGLYEGFAGAVYSKGITIRSVKGPEETILTGNSKNAILQIRSSGENQTVVEGFTFQGNAAERFGGAISITQLSSPTIRNNIFRENSAGIAGAIYISPQCSPTIEKNLFVGNVARSWGGAIYMQHAEPRVSENTFVGNVASRSGSAISMYDASPRIDNNVFLDQGGVTTIHMMTPKCVPTFSCNGHWGDEGLFLGGDENVKLPDTDSRSEQFAFADTNLYGLKTAPSFAAGDCGKVGWR
ncbi:MAG: hypothetical protein HKN20_18060 [Gemmatimonadetes bacterium]|nr:hypothetical protein [Gemmatimonadota bacterium]